MTLALLEINFVSLGNNEKDVGLLAANETDNDKDFASLIVKIWGLDKCSKSFITPKDLEILFQSKLFWWSKNLFSKLNFFESCCPMVKLERKNFGLFYLI